MKKDMVYIPESQNRSIVLITTLLSEYYTSFEVHLKDNRVIELDGRYTLEYRKKDKDIYAQVLKPVDTDCRNTKYLTWNNDFYRKNACAVYTDAENNAENLQFFLNKITKIVVTKRYNLG